MSLCQLAESEARKCYLQYYILIVCMHTNLELGIGWMAQDNDFKPFHRCVHLQSSGT